MSEYDKTVLEQKLNTAKNAIDQATKSLQDYQDFCGRVEVEYDSELEESINELVGELY